MRIANALRRGLALYYNIITAHIPGSKVSGEANAHEGLGLSITWGRPGIDAMQGAMWVEPGTDILQRFSGLAGRGTYSQLTREPATRTGTSLAGQTPRGERVWPARLHGYGQLARTGCVVLNCSGLHPHGPLHCVSILVSQASRIFLVRMRVREGGGGKEGKIRLVTYARFSFPIGMQLLFKR